MNAFLYFVSVALIALLAALLAVFLGPWAVEVIQRWRGKRLGTVVADIPVREALDSLLVSVQAEPKPLSDSDGGALAFDFQGGHFIAVCEEDPHHPLRNTASISFLGCLSVPLADIEKLQNAANDVNMMTLAPKATLSSAADEDEVDETVNMNLHVSGLRLLTDETGIEQFRNLLTSFFHLQRIAADRLEEARKEDPGALLRTRVPIQRAIYSMARAELELAPDAEMAGPWYEAPRWTVRELIFRMFGRNIPDATVLVNGAETEDALDAVVFDPERPVMTVDILPAAEAGTDVRNYHLVLRRLEAGENLTLVHVDASAAGLPVSAFRSVESAETLPEVRSTVIGVYGSSLEQFRAEAEYMAQEQGLVAQVKSPDAAYSLYWGKVLMADKRLLEAEHYLLNAWRYLADHVEENGDNQGFVEAFEDACFSLGRLYYDLGRYADSYLYMDMIVQGHRLRWTQQYILTLQALGDPRVSAILKNLRESVNPEAEEGNEIVADLFAFIDRQEIVADIRRGNTDRAREALQKRLEANPDDEFALSWLKRLSR